jgi:hypothetical protein
MFEDLSEILLGPWGIVSVLLIATQPGRQLLRRTFKTAVKTGMTATDTTTKLLEQVQRFGTELIDEVKAEGNGGQASAANDASNPAKKPKTRS